MTAHISIVGGGLAGLTAAVACAENGMAVTLYEAHRGLGGRARSTAEPFVANDGTHVFYGDGEPYRWLARRRLVQPPTVRELARFRFRHGDRLRALPPGALFRMMSRRGRPAPVDEEFGTWAGREFGTDAARVAAGLVGVITYEADAGRLSAAFVWERFRRVTALRYPTAVRYVIGGWGAAVGRMATYARSLGVHIEVHSRVDALPAPPVIVATTLDAARSLLGDGSLRWESGRAALLDLGLRAARGDVYAVSDLDEAGFLARYSLPDPSLAPPGHSLVQAEMPMRADESAASALSRVERLADLGLPGWRDRVAWRREGAAQHRTGALDLPGHTWRDRPAVERGDGVWLAGDSVAAPGLLSEVSINSALQAAQAAVDASAGARH
jgi:phytoene dehydrogenase-like protein